MLQYRGLPFTFKPHGIINSTGINEGIAQVCTRFREGEAVRALERRCLSCPAEVLQAGDGVLTAADGKQAVANATRFHPHLPTHPPTHPPTRVQGANFETSTSPIIYESYLTRPVQATFTGAPPGRVLPMVG